MIDGLSLNLALGQHAPLHGRTTLSCGLMFICSPLRGWNKGTDRAIYAVEP